ncbi:MAG: cupin domain-containing protein [Novosphingobium sp.]|nr:cupin domain-containing protein [Novosphingobium sp.]
MTDHVGHRRVVTGHDDAGKSCVMIDGLIPRAHTMGGVAWRTDTFPADNSARTDFTPEPYTFDLMHRSTIFMVNEYPPGFGAEPYWHATDTIDYISVLQGEITFMTETGEVTLGPGEFLVDRGINHAWRNDSEAPAITAIVTVPAQPVGQGRSV